MPRLAPVSVCSGLLLLLSLGGCATTTQPLDWSLLIGRSGAAPVEFLADALAADSGEREKIWLSVRDADLTTEQKLRRALMQSVPGHSGYNAGAAQRQLRSLTAKPLAADLKAIASVRLHELESAGQCRLEVQHLRQRMSRVVDIERQLNGDRP